MKDSQGFLLLMGSTESERAFAMSPEDESSSLKIVQGQPDGDPTNIIPLA